MTTTTDTITQADGYEPAVIDRGRIMADGFECIRVLSNIWSDVRRLPAAELDARRTDLAEQIVAAIDLVRAMHRGVYTAAPVPPPPNAAEIEAGVREAMKRCAPIDPGALEAARDVIAKRWPAQQSVPLPTTDEGKIDELPADADAAKQAIHARCKTIISALNKLDWHLLCRHDGNFEARNEEYMSNTGIALWAVYDIWDTVKQFPAVAKPAAYVPLRDRKRMQDRITRRAKK